MPRLPSLLRPPIGFAHRGASAHAPENTLEAFVLARRLGATGLESDVWLTADGVPVLDHHGKVGTRVRRRRIGLHRTQLRHQVGAAHTVDRGVVNLRHHREPSPFTHAGAAESVDHPHLPQRVATIQRQRR